MNVQFVGIKNLTEEENSILNDICNKSFQRLDKISKKAKLMLVIKKNEKKGAKPQYILDAHFNSPSLTIKAKSDDWELKKAVHILIDKLETEIIKKTKPKFRQKTVTV